MYAMTTDYRHH